MNLNQFKFAISGLDLPDRSIRVAKMVLVEGVPRKEAGAIEGYTRQRLYQILSSIDLNFNKNLINEGLVVVELVLDKNTVHDYESIEAELIGSLSKTKD